MNKSSCLLGCQVNKHLFTRHSGGKCAIHHTAMQITFFRLAVRLTEAQLYLSTLCQPAIHAISCELKSVRLGNILSEI